MNALNLNYWFGVVNKFKVNVPFLYHLKTSQNLFYFYTP